ncbi:unnamed protein product [Litomosoides sigmodontis]|uniref:Neurotransmitter-gated ion-channel ligand-binding domain-containing protein n=1 Tax=Litomosoides sigmodontis TaxID=42156 RepID=A0A3P6TUB7_LITSI|nr:unnamed protein product [Litomosoides sigmodontis]
MKRLLSTILMLSLAVKIGGSDKYWANYDSLASIDSKEIIVEESDNAPKDFPVEVSFALNIIHLANFDSTNMDYTIDFEMQMSWIDPRLMNNYTKWIRIWEKKVLDEIWKPDPYFVNSKDSHFHYVSFPNFRMLISPDVSHIPSSVRFTWLSKNPINLMSTHPSPDFKLVSVHTHHCVVDGRLLPTSCLRVQFKLKRTGARFIVEKYIPSTLAMFFAWIAPFVPYNYEEVRIITPISEKRRFEAANEFERENFRAKERQVIRLYRRLDYFTQIFSPLLFAVFLIYYVMNVVHNEDSECGGNKIAN